MCICSFEIAYSVIDDIFIVFKTIEVQLKSECGGKADL